MILFKDKRQAIESKDKLDIVVIDNTTYGDYFVELTDEWFLNPILPLNIKASHVFPAVVIENGRLKHYINAFLRDNPDVKKYPLYLSVFKSQVDKMNKRYKERKVIE